MTRLVQLHETPLLSLPRLSFPGLHEWPAIRASLKAGRRLSFGQPWRPERESHFRPGFVRLGYSDSHLLIYSRLVDDQPSNSARQWNELTWLTGDVFELFLQHGNSSYFEFHVTPENNRLQMHLPDASAIRQHSRPLTAWFRQESCFESMTRVNPAKTGWEVFMRIDLIRLFGKAWLESTERTFRFLAARYDYQSGHKRPVLSCTAPITAVDFHQPQEWSIATLG